MALTIDNLEIQIQSDSQKATNGIEALTSSLEKLKSVVGDTSGLASNLTQISIALKSFGGLGKINFTSPIKQLEKLNDLIPTLGGGQGTQLAQNLRDIASGLLAFSSVPKVSIAPIANGIKALNDTTKSLDPARLEQFSLQIMGVSEGLSNLGGIGKTNLGSVVNALKKIPEITAALKPEIIAEFSAKVRELTTIMIPLAEQMDKIARGFNALPNAISRANKASTQAVAQNTKLKSSYSSLTTKLSSTAAKYMALYFAASKVAEILADWFNESNEYIEALNLFKVTMGDASDTALDFATKVRDLMGIDIAEWITNQGVFQRMATGFGISAEQANVMSQNLTQLAYDLSSFFNTDVETAMQKLQSGMSGQIKGLKAWGYNLSVAALQETALSLGIEQSVRTMTEAQKAQLRYITLIQKSQGIMGDMAKTLTTPANAMRVLSSQITQLKRALGDIVSVLVTKVIPYIQAFAKLMTDAAKSLAEIMGFEIKDLPSNNLDMGAEVIEGIGDSANDTEDDLKALKKQLAGFDELNILKDKSTNNELSYDLGFTMPSYDFLGDTKVSETFEKIKNDFLELIKVFKESDFSVAFERIGEFISTLKKQFGELNFDDVFSETLVGFIDTLGSAVNLVVQAITSLVEALNIPSLGLKFFEVLNALLQALGGVITSITPGLTAFVEKGLVPIADWFGGAFSEVLTTITDIFGKLGEKFTELEPKLTSLGNSLGEIVGKVWEFIEPLASTALEGGLGVIGDLADVALSLLDAVVSLADVILGDLNGSLDGLLTALQPIADLVGMALTECFGVLSSVLEYLSTTVIPTLVGVISNFSQILGPLISLISAVFTPAIEVLSAYLSYLWEYVIMPLADVVGGIFSEAFEGIASIFDGEVMSSIAAIIDCLTFLLNNVLTPIVDFVWDILGPTIEEVFKSIGEFISAFGQILKGLIQFISGVFAGDWEETWTGIKNIFGGIWEGVLAIIKSPFNALIAIFEGLANKVIDAWNWIKEAINSISIEIPDWLGGGKIGFSLKMSDHITIPRFADGGFPSMGQMFIARESGPELVGRIGNKNAVVNNEQIIQGIASAVYSAMMAAKEDGENGGTSARIIVQVGEQAIGEATVRYINGQIVQTGVNPIYS